MLLTDPRDISDLVANFAQRRVRVAVLAIIPRYVQVLAIDECRKTILEKDKRPTKEKIQEMVTQFAKFQVGVDQLTAYLHHNLTATSDRELLQMRRIWKALEDGMSRPEDYFPTVEAKRAASGGKSKAERMAADLGTKKESAESAESADDSPKTSTTPQNPPADTSRGNKLAVESAKMADRILVSNRAQLNKLAVEILKMSESPGRAALEDAVSKRREELDREDADTAPEVLRERQPGDED